MPMTPADALVAVDTIQGMLERIHMMLESMEVWARGDLPPCGDRPGPEVMLAHIQ